MVKELIFCNNQKPMENPISGNQGDVNFQFPAALDYFVFYSIVMLFQTHMLLLFSVEIEKKRCF